MIVENPHRNEPVLGKSCHYTGYNLFRITDVWNPWTCQDCQAIVEGDGGTAIKCSFLSRRRGKCPPLPPRRHWDSPHAPRVASEYNPDSTDLFQTLTDIQRGNRVYHHQPVCASLASCLDLTRCNATVLTLYVNTTTTSDNNDALLDYAVKHSANDRLIRRVNHPRDACLSIVFPTTYSSATEMRSAQHWYPHGKNNLLYKQSRFEYRKWTADHAFQDFHVEYAAVASEALSMSQLRHGYDLVLPLSRTWGRPADTVVDIHRPRKWLLTFRGRIERTIVPHYTHRWLAAEYWDTSTSDVLVDLKCLPYHDYDYPDTIFQDLMYNSTFGFAPGGEGVGSYRLGELLSTGTIPVVAHDFAPPLFEWKAGVWEQCMIMVSESRIVNVPDMLRNITKEEIRQRQAACWKLFLLVYGDKQDEDDGTYKSDARVTFSTAMNIYAVRIANALREQESYEHLWKND